MGGAVNKGKKKDIKLVNRKSEYLINNYNQRFTDSIDSLSQYITIFVFLQDCEISKYYFEANQIMDEKSVILFKSQQIIGTNFDSNNSFSINYYFEREQNILITLFRNSYKFLFRFTIGKLMGSYGQRLSFELDPKNDTKGNLVIQAESMRSDSCKLEIEIKTEFKSKKSIEPYFYVKKDLSSINDDNLIISVYKSEVLKFNTKSEYQFEKFKVDFSKFNSKFSKPLILEFHDSIKNELIGVQQISIKPNETKSHKYSETLILNKDHVSNKKTKHIISVNINQFMNYKFVDYLRGGLQISLILAIDFTASNGPIMDKKSLHSIATSEKNLYEKAITSCGNIVAHYDYDQEFPVYGYGAKINGNTIADHCFPINFQTDPNISSIDSILPIYRDCLTKILLYGPTCFAPVLKTAIKQIKESTTKNCYYILMIMTDGQINDMEETVDALVEASFMSLSVIIVGIGKGDFGNMERLDADRNPLINSEGKYAARDLVQFVEFNKFMNDGSRLASEVLEEIPKQVEEYFNLINKPPEEPINLNL